jgi:hypothetical protein
VNDAEYVGTGVNISGFQASEEIGTLAHDDRRTFNCPISVHFDVNNGTLTIHNLSRLGGRWTGPDNKFGWIDLEFDVTYKFIRPLSRKFRVVGRPGETGAYVWQQVPLDRRFDEREKEHPEWGPNY